MSLKILSDVSLPDFTENKTPVIFFSLIAENLEN